MMKKNLTYLLFCFALLGSLSSYSQRRSNDFNMFGLKLGLSQFDIKTDNFNTKPGLGFAGGFATRGNFYNNWDIQFGITLVQNNLKIEGRENITAPLEDIQYKILGAQVQLLFGYKLIGNHRNAKSDFKLTLEAGPVLMVNGKMKYSNDRYENYLIEGTALSADQIQGITGINGNGLVGISAGLQRFRLFGHYQHGFNNILNKLNKVEGNTEDFKGNVSMFHFGILLYF